MLTKDGSNDCANVDDIFLLRLVEDMGKDAGKRQQEAYHSTFKDA